VWLVRGNDGEMGEAEVSHGPGDCADVQRIARGDEDDGDAVALGCSEQGMILELGVVRGAFLVLFGTERDAQNSGRI
jgi:hypothetical protein